MPIAEFLIDTGAETELLLPAKECLGLELNPGQSANARGSDGTAVPMIIFADPAFITLKFVRNVDGERKVAEREALCRVKTSKREYDALVAERHASASPASPSPSPSPPSPRTPTCPTPASRLQIMLSPAKHTNVPGGKAILGAVLLRMLGITLRFEDQSYFLEVRDYEDDFC